MRQVVKQMWVQSFKKIRFNQRLEYVIKLFNKVSTQKCLQRSKFFHLGSLHYSKPSSAFNQLTNKSSAFWSISMWCKPIYFSKNQCHTIMSTKCTYIRNPTLLIQSQNHHRYSPNHKSLQYSPSYLPPVTLPIYSRPKFFDQILQFLLKIFC